MSATATVGASAATIEAIKQKAKRLSILSMMSTTAAGSGHPTSCMSAAELVAATFFYAMKFDPKDANSPDGDRFVLSKGHAAPVLYAALAEAGVFPESRLMTLREFSSELEGIRHRGFPVWTPRQVRLARDYLSVRGSRSARAWITVRRVSTC